MNLFPQETSYAETFNQLGEVVLHAVDIFVQVDKKISHIQEYKAQMSKLEMEGDMLVQSITQKFNTTLVTPFDRADMARLVEWVDDLIDGINHCIHDMDTYGIPSHHSYFRPFGEIFLQWAGETKKILNAIFEKSVSRDTILKSILVLRGVGSHGETVYETSLRDVFSTCSDPILVIKWKSLIESMRSITRSYKSLAKVIESILMKVE
jgi:uncharacterized protein Yka (UPF0111/DUF47 family)